jgi:hypothetical protein
MTPERFLPSGFLGSFNVHQAQKLRPPAILSRQIGELQGLFR